LISEKPNQLGANSFVLRTVLHPVVHKTSAMMSKYLSI